LNDAAVFPPSLVGGLSISGTMINEIDFLKMKVITTMAAVALFVLAWSGQSMAMTEIMVILGREEQSDEPL